MHKIRLTEEKVAARIKLIAPSIYRERIALAPLRYLAGDDSHINANVDDSGWPELYAGQYWGEHRQSFTLRARFSVPANWTGDIGLNVDMGRSSKLEALAFLYGPEALAHIDGDVIQGVDVNHGYVPLPDKYRDGQEHVLALAGWTGIRDERYEMGGIHLVQVDELASRLVHLARLTLECLSEMESSDIIRAKLLGALDDALQMLDLRQLFDTAYYQSLPVALAKLEEDIVAAGPSVPASVFGVGHAHLDLAWLWTLEQTRKKGARTFATVLRLMEKYPEFRFSQSQPQLYQFIAETQPALFEQIKARVAEGRWETMGGMWVESDCNLAGAESLARQFVLGRQYYRETFGIDGSPILWLPDVFGYAWQLPQLMQQAGISYFVTAKMSWNQYNRIPYDRFQWKGLDGTGILTYLITTSKPGWWGATYSADLTPAEIVQTRRAAQQPELHDTLMITYGHGDGGGGPTARMVEDARVLADFPGMPSVRLGTAIEFLEELDATRPTLPVWNGELYLELHRGTYTSQARNKRSNRKMEVLLHDAEFLAAWASLDGAAYPHAELRRAWKALCLNQFHDIIPGSSIAAVYADSARDYAEIERVATQIRAEALRSLDSRLPQSAGFVVYNPTSFPRSETIDLGDGPAFVADVPAYGYRVVSREPNSTGGVSCIEINAGSDKAAHPETRFVLEHDTLRVEFDAAAQIVRLVHKPTSRDALPSGAKANVWQLFEDRPLDWDAWDIDIFYDDKQFELSEAASIRVAEAGGMRGVLEVTRQIESSTITQRIVLRHGSDRIDFETTVDWRERNKLLKVAFPVDILSPTATYDIQWGNVERPTHANTSWDWARFESCAHKWVDLSESGFGVSLLNDCKYGHDIHGNVIRLTALKGATFPDPDSDLGEHRFTYSLLPHVGSWRDSTVREAYSLNHPLIVRTPENARIADGLAQASLIGHSNPNVIIETIKRAEDDRGIVIRAYEYARSRGRVAFKPDFTVAKAAACNLHEDAQRALPANDLTLSVTPFQIVTLRLDT